MSTSKITIYDVTSKEYRTINGTIIFKTTKDDGNKIINTHYKINYVYNIIEDEIVYSYGPDWERKVCEIFKNDLDECIRQHWRTILLNGMEE